MDDDTDDRIMDVNVTGLIKGTRVALLHLARRGGGAIVHFASVAGFVSIPNFATCCASKHAVVAYTRSFQWMPDICQVRVNAVCPEWVETDMVLAAKANKAYDPYYDLIRKMPRAKLETVIEAVLLLLTDTTKNTQTWLALEAGLMEMKPSVDLGKKKTE
ncbi:hypothetical protein BD560DRAFT_215439 [Blakeslea trispora]|nr:hypothetical protein BD560DRAFT_215439 [Blakeslea trispora]